jgi:hypothetical protein
MINLLKIVESGISVKKGMNLINHLTNPNEYENAKISVIDRTGCYAGIYSI